MEIHTKKCALCLNPAKLSDSHIISESFYTDLYEEPHPRLSIISPDPTIQYKPQQKGLREFLLCFCCEQKLGNDYERTGAKSFRNLKARAIEQQRNFTFDGLDYGSFKLFQLAQLWRMAKAKHKLWQNVVLPPTILEDIGRKLLSGDAGDFDCYGVMMEAIIADDGGVFDGFVQPIPKRIGDYEFVLATFSGFSWYYCVHQSVNDDRLKNRFMMADGTVEITVKKLSDASHIQHLAERLAAEGKLEECHL